MNQQTIDRQHFEELERRAHRVSAVIENVGQQATDANMRTAAQLTAERIQELLEQIREIIDVDPVDAQERMAHFEMRLDIAQRKMSVWPLTKKQQKVLEGQKKIEALAA
ncbi:MAG: hypothetical protein AAGD10_21805 [Myxococcota bacterium]